jgi:hypothetical protein
MINEDQALEIARQEFSAEIRDGGWPTLFGYPDHWIASCAYPGQAKTSRSIRINGDGSVKR